MCTGKVVFLALGARDGREVLQVQRAWGMKIHQAADAAVVLGGRGGLVHIGAVDQVRRQRIELERAMPSLSRQLSTIDEHGIERRPEAADGDRLTFADLVAGVVSAGDSWGG